MYSTSVSGHVSASREQVYRALLDPEAIARWRVPDGMTSRVHEFDPREGGRFRVSLTYSAPADEAPVDTAPPDTQPADTEPADNARPDGDAADQDRAAGKSTAHTDTYNGHFAQLIPDERVVEIIQFEAAEDDLRSPMTMTTVLRDAPGGGTDVTIGHDGIPDAVPPADNEAGTQMALANLARVVENHDSSA